jgi:hypothetical protein
MFQVSPEQHRGTQGLLVNHSDRLLPALYGFLLGAG